MWINLKNIQWTSNEYPSSLAYPMNYELTKNELEMNWNLTMN
jgi:hypothetical protein